MSEQKIKELEFKIMKHKNLYYAGKPEISDAEYDELEESLKKLDPNSEVLELIGSAVFSNEKVEHASKMLSLNKTYKLEELEKWRGESTVLSTFKIDGSSCSLIYEEGNLKLAKTRGDGRFGENITNKIFYMSEVPKKLSKTINVEVRGEVYCTQENFSRISKAMEARGLDKPNSMRNIVAGLLGRKENIDLSEYLSFQAFELFGAEKISTEKEKFDFLNKEKFKTPSVKLNNSVKELELRLKEAKEFMLSGDYLIDGLVFSYNELSLHQELGETAHHPRYKMAYKFQGISKTTKIESISWQVSRNGILTPVANVEAVELSGALVSRVTLHNYGVVRDYSLKAGDQIEIVRSGEVIPKFLSVIKSSDTKFDVPKSCPSCKQKIKVEDIRLICVNEECPDKIKDEILNFIRKIGIDDLSSKRLEELIKQKVVKDITSLYEMTKEQLLEMDKVKEKLASKLIKSIEKSKDADLITFLGALGISGGAYNKCEKIVNFGHNTIDKVMALKISDFEQIESFAEKSATDFYESLQSKKKMIEKLKSYGFSFKSSLATAKESAVTGKKFCITGTLTRKRSDLEKIVKEHGGIVQSAVSKETDFLITNDTLSSSSKFKKAQSLSIPILNEEMFFNLIKE